MSPAAAIASSGLFAATLRLGASASNLANAGDATAVGQSGYRPLGVLATPAPGGGVAATLVATKPASFLAYDPASPLASAQGLVAMPQIDPIAEVARQLVAGRAFAAALEALEVAGRNEKTLLDLKT
ncbi:MAG TPA: hypothetical protein VMU93_01175 [Caulobacteraceae bacterium]|nr:hypothetical protein [Caulobacteraceae bacterium]